MTLMPHNFNDVEFLLGDADTLRAIGSLPARAPFSPEILAFVACFSQALLRQPEVKAWSDVASLAFWCRPASLQQMQDAYPDLAMRQGRGVAFHIAPANVAVNFAYSLLVGLLTGNANVVRLPGKSFHQVEMICQALKEALVLHPPFASAIVLVRYDKQRAINDVLSGMCQTRLIWGGDATIMALRQSPLPPRSLDIAFANRHSFAVIDAGGYLQEPDKARIALDFYNDTLHSDQNACSSPGLVVWLGNDAALREQARQQFWHYFDRVSAARYTLQSVSAVEKLSAFCLLSAEVAGVVRQPVSHNRLVRVELPELTGDSLNYSGSCGYFLEYQANSIDEIAPVCGQTTQTLSYCGLSRETIEDFIRRCRPSGIDRIVPVGQALRFTLLWDGYDLIRLLTLIRA